MGNFEKLKLDERLVGYLEAQGYHRPTALQEEAVPVIARGTNVVGVATAGSGKTLAYGLGLAARLDPETAGPQALVLRPTDDAAAATADALYHVVRTRGLATELLNPRVTSTAHIVLASPSAALNAIEQSTTKLDGVRALVVDGASAMSDLGAGEALETLTAQVPKDAQRVLLTSELTREVDGWIDRHARRAWKLAYLPAVAQPLANASAEYWLAPRALWLGVLVNILNRTPPGGSDRFVVRCRLTREAQHLADRLRARGLDVSSAEDTRIRIESMTEDQLPPGSLAVSWGVPPDLPTFKPMAEGVTRILVFLEPGEQAHLQRLASVFSVKLGTLRTSLPDEALKSAQHTREQLRDAASTRDLEPYMLLIEPLLDEHTPIQLAAAATALLRERSPKVPAQPLPAWTRLYFAVGRRDGIRPADLVGAITGEASVTGDRIGRIEIRDTHSSVEVAASVADRVIKSLATATIRGRPANVRVFRE
jgi:ATP-dependent RNA helicase DeaD